MDMVRNIRHTLKEREGEGNQSETIWMLQITFLSLQASHTGLETGPVKIP